MMVWMLCPVNMLNGLGIKTEGKKIWEKAEAKSRYALPMVYLGKVKDKMDLTSYSVLNGIANPLISDDATQRVP